MHVEQSSSVTCLGIQQDPATGPTRKSAGREEEYVLHARTVALLSILTPIQTHAHAVTDC